MENKRAPVQGWAAGIPWELHLEAYSVYCKRWGAQKAMIEDGCRGGFHAEELDDFIPGWRERSSRAGQVEAALRELVAQVDQGHMAFDAVMSPSVTAAMQEANRLLGSPASGGAVDER